MDDVLVVDDVVGDEAAPSLVVRVDEVDVVGELPLHLLRKQGSLLVQVVVAVYLVVLKELGQADELILAEYAGEVQAFLYHLFLFELVLCGNALAARVVGPAEGVGDDLHEEPEEVDLPLLDLADAGDAVDLLEVEHRGDVEEVIFFLDGVHCEVLPLRVGSLRVAMHGQSVDEAHALLHWLHVFLVLFIEVALAVAFEIVIDLLLPELLSFFLILLILRAGLIDLNNMVIIHGILVGRIAVLPFLIEQLFVRLFTDIRVGLVEIRHMFLEFRVVHVGTVVL